MKLGGYRRDGTLRVLIPGGMTILLHGEIASPPLDDREADAYGPWVEPDANLTWQERQELGKRLDRARTVPLHSLRMPTGDFVSRPVASGAGLLARLDAIKPLDLASAEPSGDSGGDDERVAAVADMLRRGIAAKLKKPDAPEEDAEAKAPAAGIKVPGEKPVAPKPSAPPFAKPAAKPEPEAEAKPEAEAAATSVPASSGPKRSTKRLTLEYSVDDSEGEERKPVSEVSQPNHLKPMEK